MIYANVYTFKFAWNVIYFRYFSLVCMLGKGCSSNICPPHGLNVYLLKVFQVTRVALISLNVIILAEGCSSNTGDAHWHKCNYTL